MQTACAQGHQEQPAESRRLTVRAAVQGVVPLEEPALLAGIAGDHHHNRDGYQESQRQQRDFARLEYRIHGRPQRLRLSAMGTRFVVLGEENTVPHRIPVLSPRQGCVAGAAWAVATIRNLQRPTLWACIGVAADLLVAPLIDAWNCP